MARRYRLKFMQIFPDWFNPLFIFFFNLARDFDLAKSEKMLRNVSALIFLPIIFCVNTLFVL